MKQLFIPGDEIVAINSSAAWKKDEEFVVLDVKQDCCSNTYLVKINKNLNGPVKCGNCRKNLNGSYFWQENFRLKDNLSETSYEEAVKIVNSKKPLRVGTPIITE